MPTITLNKTVFERLVGKTLPLEELKDRISMLGTDLEKIEGNEIHVEVFPNRPDMLSEQGFARAFSSFIGVKTGLKEYRAETSHQSAHNPNQTPHQKVIVDPSVKSVRPFTACAIVKGLHFSDERIRELIQLQEKLHLTYGRNRKKAAIGVYPLEKITFPITYKALPPEKIKFRPLGAEKEMSAAEILKEHKTGKEYAYLLEGSAMYPLFVDAAGEILSMPPIINSHTTGMVTEDTKDVFIECSGFDFHALSICLNIIVTALADMGGKIYGIELHDGTQKDSGGAQKERIQKNITPDLRPRKMLLAQRYVNKRLGLQLSQKEMQILLERMGHGVQGSAHAEESAHAKESAHAEKSARAKKIAVLIPPYRADILHPVDLVEDIAIAYGYENFIPEIPQVATIGSEDTLEKFTDRIRELLTGMELLEVKNYHLLSEEELIIKMGCEKQAAEKPIPRLIRLKNAVGEHNCLRHSLLPGLLKALAENQHHRYPHLIFEVGKIFAPGRKDTPEEKNATEVTETAEKTESGVEEKTMLGIALCHEQADFTALRQIVDIVLGLLDIEGAVKEAAVKEAAHESLLHNSLIEGSFIDGRAGNIVAGKHTLGIMGEVHPAVLEKWSLAMPAVVMEIDAGVLLELVKRA